MTATLELQKHVVNMTATLELQKHVVNMTATMELQKSKFHEMKFRLDTEQMATRK